MEAKKMTVSSTLEAGQTDLFETERAIQRHTFLKLNGLENEVCAPLPCDASNRRYFRLSSALLMDAPPPHEDSAQFHLIAEILANAGLSVPQVYASDHLNGFLLIEDWGDATYRKALHEGIPEIVLYKETIESLTHLHKELPKNTMNLQEYDLPLFLEKACLFTEWYDAPFSEQAKNEFKEIWENAFYLQPKIPYSLAMRDVMVDNLMWLPDCQGWNRCGFIDFQDATWTPITYDIASLLGDARRDIEPALAHDMIELYMNASPHIDREAFLASYSLWGAQRATRILGIFHRLAKRDGKTQYKSYVPRLWKNLDQYLSHPSLKDVRDWFKKAVKI